MLRSPGRRAGILLALILVADSASAETLDLAITVGSDDVEETGSGQLLFASGDLGLGVDATPQTVGLRFPEVAIPPDHRVTAAWLQFRADDAGSAAAALSIQGEAAANAAPFVRTTGSLSARPRTAVAVAWSPPAWVAFEAGPSERTPDLAPVLQAIVDGPGWASGNALALILTGTGTRSADSFEGGFGPQLHVEFEPAGDRPPELSLTSPAAGAVFAAGDPIPFAATATDVEDGDLSAAVVFTSDLDGPLGSGSPLVRSDLSPGLHQIGAAVTDSGGNTVSATGQLLVTPGSARILAAGDIASCSHPRDEQTAAVLDGLEGLVLTLGDNAYPNGTAQEFASCYEPSWGRHKARTRPAAGNHDFNTSGATGYFGYFGAAAGPAPQGWYSFDYGGWHFVALNSNCSAIGGCTRASAQGLWLEADLDAHPSRCTLAYWHHPRFASSSIHGSSILTRDLWAILQEHGADVALVGHDHNYERFAPQNASGIADPLGIREFVVGTGGAALYAMGAPEPNSEVRDDTSHGVISLDLAPDAYAWRFHPVAGHSFTDSGVASCVAFAPELSVSSPVDGAVFAFTAPIEFAGAASDVEEGDLGASLVWSSSLDGEIGSGNAFATTSLSCGLHLVTVSVTDAHGGSDQQTLTLQVGPEGCLIGPLGCGLGGPELVVVLALLTLASRRASPGPNSLLRSG
jgi:Calcineurin-like phosphoesterase